MSVYNRKMFKPRNARNALNQSAGIAPVQTFHAGGPVGHTHQGNIFQRFMNAPNTLGGVVSALRGNATPAAPATQPMIPVGANPRSPISMSPIEAAAIREARTPPSIGGRVTSFLDYDKGISGVVGDAVGPDSSNLGIRSLQELAKGSAFVLGDLPATAGAAIAAPFASQTDMGAGTKAAPAILAPGVLDAINKGEGAFPEDLLGVDLMTIPGFQSGTKTAPLPAGTAPGTSVRIGEPGAVSKPRPETAAQMMERIATADAGMTTDMDPNEALMQQIAMDDAGMTTDMSAAEQEAAAEAAFQENVDQTDRDAATFDSAPDASAAAVEAADAEAASAARTDTDPNAGASITAPKPKPENFAEIVAQAKGANAKAGVPPLGSDEDEIDTAAQAGTGSAEDIKAEFLKLLPKYEEDPSIQGLNLAMMGFAIAGGESSNAMKNIADGMKKGLPAFIKSKEKRKAFERETDLLASKYAIQRMEGDRTRGFSKNDYYVIKDFEGPDGRKYTAGQPLKLNDQAFTLMEQQGLTGNLVSGTIYGKMLDNTAAVEKAKASAKPTSYHQKSSKTLDIGGNKIEVYYPTADAPEGTKAFPAGREEGWKSFTGKYTTQLEQLSFGQKSLSTARGILSKGDAVGSAGAFGKALDATKAFVPRSIGERMGLDYDNLSSANELENLNRTLALQLAKPLLQEGGKTISNFERMQVAKALGYSDAAVDSTGTIILGNMNNMFTTQADAENRIALIEGILQRSAEKLHSDYKDTATLFGYELTTPEQAVASAPSGSLGNLEQRDDGKFYFVTGQ